MRFKPPLLPPAASLIPQATQGPRVLPGTYQVKLTKGDKWYTETLQVVLDPRAKYNVDDRKRQYDLVMKLYRTMAHMTYAVDAIQGVRDHAQSRAAKLRESDPLREQLQKLSRSAEDLRSRIVATKEGGMITGEERIREHMGELYGAVNHYEGRPGDYQVARTDSLSRELEDVITDFRKLTDKELSGINSSLQKKKMATIKVLAESDWHQKYDGGGSAHSPGVSRRELD